MPVVDDDDSSSGGPPSYWLKYKVWGVPGWMIVLGVFALGVIVGSVYL